MLNIAAFIPRSTVNGPGERAVVWVQGCPRQPPCSGCFNPGMLDGQKEVGLVATEELVQRILAIDGLSGVTFSGGEPFSQAADLALVASDARLMNLTVVVFTGHVLAELQHSEAHRALLAATDLLIAGPFEKDMATGQPLLSSANQRHHFLSNRICSADLDSMAEIEVLVGADGEVTLSGFPPR
jgi:anaerobic ribonucleoside-triphosphate reductase activating protein